MRTIPLLATVVSVVLAPAWAVAEETAAPTVESATEAAANATFVANNVWMMLCAALVFLMHLGFATLESGLSRSKNTVNILYKNVFIVCVGILTYYFVGFGLMYPGDGFNGYFGFAGFPLDPGADGQTIKYVDGGYTYWTDFLFQAMFAATCTTIISGAVAERIKLHSFLLFATLFVLVVYPIGGSWKWGGGFLDKMGFYDFAGSTIVHSMGGWGALVGAWILGPRIGKYGKNGVTPIPGSNMVSATIGVMLLWLGWFGFNGGSVLSADPAAVSYTLVTTCLAAAAGAIGAFVGYSFISRKPDLSMLLNGILAGLVGITAGADVIPVGLSVLVGFIAGVLVVYSVVFFDKIKVDDPVGATSVHLVCGIWGTIAVGLFSTNPEHSLVTQLIGIGVYAGYTLVASLVLFSLIKATIGLRVSEEEEIEGLDAGEHEMHAYDMAAATTSIAHPTMIATAEPTPAE